MTFDEIMEAISMLSHSQGSYGRLLRSIQELSEDELQNFKETMEAQNFKDVVDMIMFLEG